MIETQPTTDDRAGEVVLRTLRTYGFIREFTDEPVHGAAIETTGS